MREKVFFIRGNGEVDHVLHPSSNNHGYVDGDTDDNGRLIKRMDEHVDIDHFIVNKYWDFNTSSWEDRDQAPSQYYYWGGTSWVFNQSEIMKIVRAERMRFLSSSDWTQLPDAPISTDMKNAWAVYRQELRDITEVLDGIENLDDVIWPTKPE
jgi:hypothetical protein